MLSPEYTAGRRELVSDKASLRLRPGSPGGLKLSRAGAVAPPTEFANESDGMRYSASARAALLTASVNLRQARDKQISARNDLFTDRRPELYTRLSEIAAADVR